MKDEYTLPEGWEAEVYLLAERPPPGSVENRDDQGGYPEEDDLRAAFDALGYDASKSELTPPRRV